MFSSPVLLPLSFRKLLPLKGFNIRQAVGYSRKENRGDRIGGGAWLCTADITVKIKSMVANDLTE